MENERTIFGLTVDELAKIHLGETAKWGKFFAIIGFLGIAAMILIGALMMAYPSLFYPVSLDPETDRKNMVFDVIGLFIVAVMYFFPCYFTLNFSNKLKTAIRTEDAYSLNEAFRNLKITFRYIGVLTIIFLVLIFIGLIGGLTGGS